MSVLVEVSSIKLLVLLLQNRWVDWLALGLSMSSSLLLQQELLLLLLKSVSCHDLLLISWHVLLHLDSKASQIVVKAHLLLLLIRGIIVALARTASVSSSVV